MGGGNGRKNGEDFQERIQRTHGQNQRGVGSMVGSGVAGVGGSGGGEKWRQLYLNNN